MTVIKEELEENSPLKCACDNQARYRYSWATGRTHERLLCGGCQSVLELALSTQGFCSEFDNCQKCRNVHV